MTQALACRLVLLGMMGSGKTTLGRLLADRTGWTYRDNDALLAEASSRTARQVAREGVDALRAAEAAALRHAMQLPAPVIVGAAAGVVTDPALRTLLRRRGVVIWLRAAPDVLAGRAASGTHRPWLDGDAAAWMAATAAEREPLYRELADVVVDTSTLQPAETADQIMAALPATSCGPWLGTALATVKRA